MVLAMPVASDFPYPRRYNDADLRETLEYIAYNPVKRGYVSKPQFYPFTGFGLDAVEGAV